MKCWFCGGEVRWCADFNADEYGYDGEGIVAELECMACNASITCAQIESSDDDDALEQQKSEIEAREFYTKLLASKTFRALVDGMPGENYGEKCSALLACINPTENPILAHVKQLDNEPYHEWNTDTFGGGRDE